MWAFCPKCTCHHCASRSAANSLEVPQDDVASHAELEDSEATITERGSSSATGSDDAPQSSSERRGAVIEPLADDQVDNLADRADPHHEHARTRSGRRRSVHTQHQTSKKRSKRRCRQRDVDYTVRHPHLLHSAHSGCIGGGPDMRERRSTLGFLLNVLLVPCSDIFHSVCMQCVTMLRTPCLL